MRYQGYFDIATLGSNYMCKRTYFPANGESLVSVPSRNCARVLNESGRSILKTNEILIDLKKL